MKNSIKRFVVGVLCIFTVINSGVYATTSESTIDVVLNSINIALEGEKIAEIGQNYTLANGQEVPYSISYKETTYLPIRKVAELFNKEVTWNQATRTAGLLSKKTIIDNVEAKQEEAKQEEAKQEEVKQEEVKQEENKVKVSVEELKSTIGVVLNSINIALEGEKIAEMGQNYTLANGQEVPYSISYKETTYLPIRKVAELLDKEVTWDQATRTAGLLSEKTSNDNVDVKKLKASLDVVTIDGMYSDPYGLNSQEAQVFIIAKTEKDFKAFSGLTKKEKAIVLNDIVQENYGSFLGVEAVYVDFIFNGESYIDFETDYDVKAEDIALTVREKGESIIVLKQVTDDQDFTTYEYYYDNGQSYPYALTDEEIKEAIAEGKKGIDHVFDIEEKQYTFTTDSDITNNVVIVTPYLSIMRLSAMATYDDEVLSFENAKDIYNDFDMYNFIDFEFSLFSKSKNGHQDLTVYLEQGDSKMNEESFIPMGLDKEGKYDKKIKKYKAYITLSYSNMISEIQELDLLDYSKNATFKVVLNNKEDVYDINFSSLK